jgi:hypothetical protein
MNAGVVADRRDDAGVGGAAQERNDRLSDRVIALVVGADGEVDLPESGRSSISGRIWAIQLMWFPCGRLLIGPVLFTTPGGKCS